MASRPHHHRRNLIPMPLTTEERAERHRTRMLEKAREFQTTTYSTRFVAPLFQRMVRAEAGADPRQFVTAVVDGEIRQVERSLGFCACVTCGKVLRWDSGIKGLHTGHFLASRRNSILLEESNCAPQCSACNYYRSGAPQEFRLWMRFVRGPECIERLEKLKTESRTFGRDELVDLRIAYAARLAAAEASMRNGS
jgi:hypothetical protein